MSRSNKPSYADIHSNDFDPVRMSAGQLAKADSFTRAAATEALDRKYRGNFDYHAFSHTESTGGNGERNSASKAKRWAGAQTRAKQYMYNDAIQAEQQRQSLDRQVLAGRDRMKDMEGQLASLKEQMAANSAAGPKDKPKGDLVIESPGRSEPDVSTMPVSDGGDRKQYDLNEQAINKTDAIFDESTTADTPEKDPQAFADQYKLNLIDMGATKKPNEQDKPELMPS